MSTFKELMRVIQISIKDKTSSKRMKEIESILKKHEVFKGLTPQKATSILEDLGPTFVKMGQIASNRSDILPNDYCEAFKALRSNVEPVDFSTILTLIEDAYQAPWTTVFSSIKEEPLGSASIAQVHQAVLLDGTGVAVKVRRAGIVEEMAEDITLMKHLLALAEFSAPKEQTMLLTFDGLVSELERTTADEVDFNVELNNLERFSQDLTGQYGVHCPVPYPQFSTQSVLVMEYVTGTLLNKKDELTAKGVDLESIGYRLAQSYITQVIDNGFFHADPHPGNILIEDDMLIWIDLGMVGSLTSNERALLDKMFSALAAKDSFELKEPLLALTKAHGPVDHGLLLDQIDSLLSSYASTDLASINVGQAFVEIIEILRSQNLVMTSSFTMLARGLLTLEGVLADIAPHTSVTKLITQHIKKKAFDLEELAHKAKDFTLSSIHSAELAVKIPTQVSHSLDMLNKGQLNVNAKMQVEDDLLGSVYAMGGRIGLAMISAGLFVGSSILCTTKMEPQILEVPVLGFLGYLGAFVLGVYVIWQTIVAKRSKSGKD